MKDYKTNNAHCQASDKYMAAKTAFEDAKAILDEGGHDAEFKELAQM